MTHALAGGMPQLTSAFSPVYRYIPMLKAKSGETTALENLSTLARARIVPLFHIGETLKPSFIEGLATAWSGTLAAVDGSFNFNHTLSTTTTVAMIAAMRNKGIPTMPCFGPADHPIYQQAARAIVDVNGTVVKVQVEGIPHLQVWLASQYLPANLVDLVVDLKHIGSYSVGSLSGYISAVLRANAAFLQSFRSVTLAASAAPKDHGSLALGVNLVPRSDWALWTSVRHTVPFQLDYGDYLTGHPDLKEPPGAAMAKATVSARYTLDNSWMIIKGRQTSGPNGLPMRQQYHSHAGLIANDPGFSGIPNVWADNQIGSAAGGAPGMGSRAKWSGFAANRHMSLVADRLP